MYNNTVYVCQQKEEYTKKQGTTWQNIERETETTLST
jgi:hypothetical protein